MSYSGNLLLRGLINVVSKPQTLPVRGMIFAANHHFNHNRMSEFLAQNFLHSGINYALTTKKTRYFNSRVDGGARNKVRETKAGCRHSRKGQRHRGCFFFYSFSTGGIEHSAAAVKSNHLQVILTS